MLIKKFTIEHVDGGSRIEMIEGNGRKIIICIKDANKIWEAIESHIDFEELDKLNSSLKFTKK